jgi:hypothetical protein
MNSIKIVFVGLARDASKYLRRSLSNIERVGSLASDVGYIIIENDSIDETKKILSDWGASRLNFSLITLDGLGMLPIRTLRLEYLRNICIEYIKTSELFRTYTHMMILDLDDSNAFTIDINSIAASIKFLDEDHSRAAIFANQIGHYYDLWALRHDDLCPLDAWEEVFDYTLAHNVSDEVAFENTFKNRIFSLDKGMPPLEVRSAFGGLGVYKMQYILKNPNPYLGSKIKLIGVGSNMKVSRWQVCEHVHFNEGITNLGGKLFINPQMINGVYSSPIYPPSAYKSLIFG